MPTVLQTEHVSIENAKIRALVFAVSMLNAKFRITFQFVPVYKAISAIHSLIATNPPPHLFRLRLFCRVVHLHAALTQNVPKIVVPLRVGVLGIM